MSIRIASNCAHCEAFETSHMCGIHKIKVNENYTCERFSMIPELDTERSCTNCARHTTESCAHPETAAAGMMCASWAPQA